MKLLLSLIPILLLLGCSSTKLDPAGVYHGDAVLFEAEQTLTTGFDLLDSFVKWEKDFRPMLSSTPEVKQAADVIRLHAKEWFRTGFALKAAYQANPTDGNRTALLTSLSVIKSALSESAVYLSKYGPAKK